MTQLQQKITLPAAMAEKLDGVRRRTFRVRLGTAVVASLGVLLAAMAVAMLIDGLTTLYDSHWRAVLTYSAWGAAAATLAAWALAAWRHTQQIDRVAAQVDREIPELEERWSTVTELSANAHNNVIHPAMFQQVSGEAQSWTPRISPDRVVRLDGLIRALLCLTVLTATLGLAVLFGSPRMSVLLRRFWQPFTPISATELTDVSGDLVVGRGEALDIAATVVGEPVDEATLLLEEEAGETRTISLMPRGDAHDQVVHRLRSVSQPYRYRLRAGDGQTPWYEIVVADRPQLEQVELSITPPAYANKEPKVLNKLPRRVTALEGSTVSIAFKPKQPLEQLELKLTSDRTEQLTVDEQGWYHWETTLSETITFQPLLTEEHGLTNLRPPTCEIRCRPDNPPVVKILTPNAEMAVRPDEKVPVTFVASDDVGIHQAELIVYDESQQENGQPAILDRIPIPLGDQQGEVNVKATVELDLSKYKTADGSELSFSIRVREDRGQQLSDSPADSLADSGDSNPIAPPQMGDEATPSEPPNPAEQAQRETTEQVADAEPAQANDDSATATNEAEAPSDQQAQSDTDAPDEPSPQAEMPSDEQIADLPTDEREALVTENGQNQPEGEGATAQADNQSANESGEAMQTSEGDQQAQVQQAEQSEQQPNNATGAGDGRTTDSQRQSLSTDEQDGTNEENPAELPQDSTSNGATNDSSKSPSQASTPADESTNEANSSSGSSSQNSSEPSEPSQSQPSTPSPGDTMNRRELDVPQAQSSNSQRMRLQIDEWAGSFDGQQREKLEIAIAPRLEELDRVLEKAEALSRSVLDEADAGKRWSNQHTRDLQSTDKQIESALGIVDTLEKETYGTPYAFIGLQLVDISQAHIGPARRDFWKALQSTDEPRIEAVRHGWQHTVRARELMVLLTERFERTRTEYQMAESIEQVKKMYRVFVEDALALLQPDDEGSRYQRKMVEFELDEEYLKRLEEVLEMRNEMRAELARILADDPRLLRRLLDSQRNRQRVLRNELDHLIEGQDELNRETEAWNSTPDNERPQLEALLLARHVESAQDLALSAAELHDRFETWSPLGEESDDQQFQAASQVLEAIATSTRELSADGLAYLAESRRAKVVEPSDAPTDNPTAEPETPTADEPTTTAPAISDIADEAQQLYDRFTEFEVLLRQIGSRQDRQDLALFANNRLLETRRLLEQTSAWNRQLKHLQAGEYHRAAEVAQYGLAIQTDALAGKLAGLEQTLAGLLQNEGGQLPQSIADKARALLAALDEQASPNQLGAVYALRRNQLPRAVDRQQSALNGLQTAAQLYDDMIAVAIEQLDQLPVQDPIASLLEDPTLDELLAQLEQEIPIEEILGIPSRPSNLQILSDWLNSGGDNSLSTGGRGGNAQMLADQLRQQQGNRQRQLDRAYQLAVARALQEATAEDLVQDQPQLAQETADWNRLASELRDDIEQGRDKAPPERYRRAIEQYFQQISGADDGTGDAQP